MALTAFYQCDKCDEMWESKTTDPHLDAESNGEECPNAACDSMVRVWPYSIETSR